MRVPNQADRKNGDTHCQLDNHCSLHYLQRERAQSELELAPQLEGHGLQRRLDLGLSIGYVTSGPAWRGIRSCV